MENQQFWYFSKGKLVYTKNPLHQKTHRVFFSSRMLVFRAPTAKIRIIDYSKKRKYLKTRKNCFYRSLRKVESFPFFLQFSTYFTLTSSRYTSYDSIFNSQTARATSMSDCQTRDMAWDVGEPRKSWIMVKIHFSARFPES